MSVTTRLASRAVLISLAFATAARAQEAIPAAWRPALDKFAAQIKADVAADNAGSITAAAVRDGKVVWTQSFGWADRDKHSSATAASIYRIGSISKSFTAVALMQAVERGKVNLDAPVAKYLPDASTFADPKPGAAPPTMRQLASHTAGLVREPALPNAAAGPIAQWENKILASIPMTRFQTAPGEKYSYSNIGFGVLGLATSRAVGTPFMTLVSEGIFQPLGMQSSTYIIDERLRPKLTTGYTRESGADPAKEHDGRGYKVPNGGIYTTVGDLAKFIGLMTGSAGDRVLSAKSRSEMMRVQTPEDPKNGYGLGLAINTEPNGNRIVGHGGGVAGYTSYYAFDPDAKVGVILLRNQDFGQTNLQQATMDLLRALVNSGR
jgi:CubicO group peptidase (beta-lactamase class C family)